MPIPVERARAVLQDLQVQPIPHLIAQAHARHVLYEVGENPENFPAFDPILDDKITFAAYAQLAAGCSLAEQGLRDESAGALEAAASVLEHAHGPFAKESRVRGFHALVSAMAFYASGHYSRAFVGVRTAEMHTAAARIVGAFIRKDIDALITRLNEVLLADPPDFEEQSALNEWVVSSAIARAISLVLEFVHTGREDWLGFANQQLDEAGIVASAGGHPAWWWIVRLLRLMIQDLGDASLWRQLPPYFGPDLSKPLGRYIRLLAFNKLPIIELWRSQRAALPLVLDASNAGAVVNLRTSGGKTRVAELAMLQTLVSHQGGRILYLAPYRSLAVEIEQTFAASFGLLGYGVTHLYGGSRASSVDTMLAEDASIIIATPEKARALHRTMPELFNSVKLIVVDEGHLLGASDRTTRNEVFLDHLRGIARATQARMLLLSAVLPNAHDLAKWVAADTSLVASSDWKPSVERFGILRWNGSQVRIDWRGDYASFNPSFVQAAPLGFGRRRRLFPANKSEAVAATAVRLTGIGPVMIFSARAGSVPTLAEAVLLALGESPAGYSWPAREWAVFLAVAEEELDENAIEIRAARVGVICHSNRLTPQVRHSIERLMRAMPPKIIIATTTLAQGVNIGISSVVVANPYIDRRTISKRDFWNICGRAGRAFVDGEGKILYAIDETRKAWKIERDRALAAYYLDREQAEQTESGLLAAIRRLHEIAFASEVSFELLLELAASNDFTPFRGASEEAARICDLIDDELLALHMDPLINPLAGESLDWVEELFRGSLAAIQTASVDSVLSVDEVLAILKARTTSTLRRAEKQHRRAVASCGIPLTAALQMQAHLDRFRQASDQYSDSGESLPSLDAAVNQIEEWAREHAGAVIPSIPDAGVLAELRAGWLSGFGLRQLAGENASARDICRELYGYQLPWLIHAASQQLRHETEGERADTLARMALLVELGLPNELAAMIFLAGVHSRVAATELAGLGMDFGASVAEIGRNLRGDKFANELRPQVSPSSSGWLDLIRDEWVSRGPLPPIFRAFELPRFDGEGPLHVRSIGNRLFLCSADGWTKLQVTPTTKFPFVDVADDPRFCFDRVGSTWELTARDPRVER